MSERKRVSGVEEIVKYKSEIRQVTSPSYTKVIIYFILNDTVCTWDGIGECLRLKYFPKSSRNVEKSPSCPNLEYNLSF